MKRLIIGFAAASIMLAAPLAANAHEREGRDYRGYSDHPQRFDHRYRSGHRGYGWHEHRGWHHHRHHLRHRHWR